MMLGDGRQNVWAPFPPVIEFKPMFSRLGMLVTFVRCGKMQYIALIVLPFQSLGFAGSVNAEES